MGKKISADQVEMVRELVEKNGLKAKKIQELGLPGLQGCSRGRIQWIIHSSGLANSRPLKRLTPEQTQQLVEYLHQNKDEPGPAIAKKFGVDMRAISRRRIEMFGKSTYSHRVSAPTEKKRRGNISLFYAHKREALFKELLALRAGLESQLSEIERRTCNICGEAWFWSLPFFRKSSQKRSDGSPIFCATCSICQSEMSILKRIGKSAKEIRQIIHNLIWQKPLKTAEELFGRFRHDTNQHCMDSLLACTICKQQWYHNDRYFHSNGTNGNRALTGTCLACPAKRKNRKFFSM